MVYLLLCFYIYIHINRYINRYTNKYINILIANLMHADILINIHTHNLIYIYIHMCRLGCYWTHANMPSDLCFLAAILGDELYAGNHGHLQCNPGNSAIGKTAGFVQKSLGKGLFHHWECSRIFKNIPYMEAS